MMITPTAIELKENIIEYIKDSEWFPILSMYMSEPDILVAIEYLRALKENGFSFMPTLKNSWNWLLACPYSTIKVVMLVDHIASSGIPLSVVYGNPSRLERWIFESIDKHYEGSQNLDRWCKQGVLMMPLSLTRTDNLGSVHYSIWESLIIYMIHKINEGYPDVPWVIIGAKGAHYTNRIKSKNTTIITTKPKVDAHDSWNYVNRVLKSQDKEQIKW